MLQKAGIKKVFYVVVVVVVVFDIMFSCKHHTIYTCIYSGTSLLRTLWDLKISPYYSGFLNSEVT